MDIPASWLLRIATSIVFVFLFFTASHPVRAFTFVAWGDTKSDTNVLKNLSPQVKALNPTLTIFPGDLESSGFTQNGMAAWAAAMNGGVNNGLLDISFPVRGNHDDAKSGSAQLWSDYFDFVTTANRVGATSYTELNTDLTYSFDYDNTRFLGIDVVGDASLLSSAQINWIDQRLTDAEAKGLTHAFIYFHGPLYCVAEHCSCSTMTGCVSTAGKSLYAVINKHPIVTATFHGHEHVVTHTKLTSARIPELTRPLDEFVSGDAGAGPNNVNANRTDYAMNTDDNKGGFILVNVSGSTATASFYKGGSSTVQHTVVMAKSGVTPNPTTTGSSTPTRTPTPTGAAATLLGDVDDNGVVDIYDYNLVVTDFNTTGSPGFVAADIDRNGIIDIYDYNTVVTDFGKRV